MGVSADSCKGVEMGGVSTCLLYQDRQAVMIEIECLDAIPAAVDEEEEVAVEEVLAEALLDEAREAAERGIFLIPLAAGTVRTVHL